MNVTQTQPIPTNYETSVGTNNSRNYPVRNSHNDSNVRPIRHVEALSKQVN